MVSLLLKQAIPSFALASPFVQLAPSVLFLPMVYIYAERENSLRDW